MPDLCGGTLTRSVAFGARVRARRSQAIGVGAVCDAFGAAMYQRVPIVVDVVETHASSAQHLDVRRMIGAWALHTRRAGSAASRARSRSDLAG